jgi:uncharacterized membrane protein
MERLLEPDFVLAIAGLLTLALVANHVIGRIRARKTQRDDSPADLLANFRRMHAKGELSDEEFRTIKTNLVRQMQRELKRIDDRG